MTQEQYKRAVEISNRIRALEEIKKEISMGNHILSYSYEKFGGGYDTCLEYKISHIRDILDHHDRMIREEIDAEIEKLKKEIDEL